MLAMPITSAPIWSVAVRELNVSRFIYTSPKRNSLDQMESNNTSARSGKPNLATPLVTLVEVYKSVKLRRLRCDLTPPRFSIRKGTECFIITPKDYVAWILSGNRFAHAIRHIPILVWDRAEC